MEHNLKKETLKKLEKKDNTGLVALRIQYAETQTLLSYVKKLVNVNRIYPHHLPTQTSYRWSTFNPPLTNWPRACINPQCVQQEHEWDFEQCWSVRDILLADEDEVLLSWDHDNIEGRIHDIIVNDITAIKAHRDRLDLHTITCCNIFNYDMPADLQNPHTSQIDAQWRSKYNWQGKDTKRRVLAKNFNHGSKYTDTYMFVHTIPGIESYGVSKKQLEQLAKSYIKSKGDAWYRKLEIMECIQFDRIARTLYGGRRIFFDSSKKSGHEGFSHMISGTVSDYNNLTLKKLHNILGKDMRLLHNAHDGNKIAVKKDVIPNKDELKAIIERSIEYEGRSLVMTAGIKVI